MKKLVLFMHMTLDGFVSGPGNEMDWINLDDEVFDLAGERTREADTALYGRATYEMMNYYWPTAGDKPDASKHDKEHSRWYNSVSKIVISRSMVGQEIPNTTIVGEDLKNRIAALKRGPGKGIVIFGSTKAAQALMSDNLIDDYWIMLNPVVLGSGNPLFGTKKINLELISSTPLKCGVVALHYGRK